ncbi:MAG: hypothetical protein CTY12_03450 [Methylotenera sp.]|nr:MAG: hypothetical protein CTY12_03450 [Methylotenera sp.]
MLEQLQPERKLVYRAGTIPYIVEHGQIYMMFMKPSDQEFGGDRYQLAKGKVEDEDPDHKFAAIREAKEELGLFVGNVVLIEEVGVFMGRTTVFIAKVKNRDMFGEPSFETESVKWMTPEEFHVDGRDLHKPVVASCVRRIKKLEGLD